MTSHELYSDYLKVFEERLELENTIKSFVKKWENKETIFSNETVQESMDKGTIRLEKLEKLEKELYFEYNNQLQKEKEKNSSDISIRHNLGANTSSLNIVDGVISSKGEDSHLIAQSKTTNQLDEEKKQLLDQIKNKVLSGEMSLAEASKLTSDVNTSYDYYKQPTQTEQKPEGMHK